MANNLGSYYRRKASRQPVTKKDSVIFEENGVMTPHPSPTPTPITYLLLAENEDELLTENGDNLEIQY